MPPANLSSEGLIDLIKRVRKKEHKNKFTLTQSLEIVPRQEDAASMARGKAAL